MLLAVAMSCTSPALNLRCPTPVLQLNRRARRQHLQPPGTPPPPPAAPATNLKPATFAGIVEDHSNEQFFFDESTRAALLKLVASFKRPLLLCTPSLAVDADAAGLPYLLLDRDERFAFLRGFRSAELQSVVPLDDYEFDAVFCDPPFANFELTHLSDAIATLAGDDHMRSTAPLFIAYNARREEALKECFASQRLERKLKLRYCSVKERTQRHLWLYGPATFVNDSEEP